MNFKVSGKTQVIPLMKYFRFLNIRESFSEKFSFFNFPSVNSWSKMSQSFLVNGQSSFSEESDG